MWQPETEVEPFRVTPGFIAFLGVLILPAVIALSVYLGAWLVAGEVYAAQDAPAGSSQSSSADEVPGWKQTLVGICPLH